MHCFFPKLHWQQTCLAISLNNTTFGSMMQMCKRELLLSVFKRIAHLQCIGWAFMSTFVYLESMFLALTSQENKKLTRGCRLSDCGSDITSESVLVPVWMTSSVKMSLIILWNSTGCLLHNMYVLKNQWTTDPLLTND